MEETTKNEHGEIVIPADPARRFLEMRLREDHARVCLMIRGETLDPQTISTGTGLVPNRAWMKGAEFAMPSGTKARQPFGLWAVEAEGNDVETVALDLLRLVEPCIGAIRECATGAQGTMSVGIWWAPDDDQGGFSVSSDVVARLADLCEVVEVFLPGSLEHMDVGLGPSIGCYHG